VLDLLRAMVGAVGRRQVTKRVCEEEGPTWPRVKEKVYYRKEKQQLCRPVWQSCMFCKIELLAISKELVSFGRELQSIMRSSD